MSNVSQTRPLTAWRLLNLCLPMGLTFLMMSGAAPIITGGISRRYGAAGESVHLTAFQLAFAVAIFLYSPVFVARNVAIRTVHDRAAIHRYLIFFLAIAATCAAGIVVVSQVDAAGNLILVRCMGRSPEIAALARQGMLFFAPLPLLIVFRSLGQACHMNNDEAWYSGAASALRLSSMALFAFTVGLTMPGLHGARYGGMTFLVGITCETVLTVLIVITKRQWRTRDGGQPPMSYAQYSRYAMPLMGAAVIRTSIPPIMLGLISLTAHREAGTAAYNLLHATVWISISFLFSLQPSTVTCATSRDNLRMLIRFSLGIGSVITMFLVTVAFTPLRDLIFVRVLQVDNRLLLQLLYEALPWVALLPLLTSADNILNALHTRAGSTRWVTVGTISGILVLIAVAFTIDLSRVNGATMAVIAFLICHVINIAVMTAALWRSGLDAALSRRSLAETV